MASDLIDRPGAVRGDDQIDLAALDKFLKAHVSGIEGSPTLAQFAGGASNLTYLLAYPDRDFILRCPPAGARSQAAHDMVREARVMQALSQSYPHVPDIVAIDETGAVIGTEFLVMQRLSGIILRKDLPPALGLGPDQIGQLCRNVLDELVALHRIDVDAAGLAWIGKGGGYVGRQVEGWNARWDKALTDDAPGAHDIVAWLRAKQPGDSASCVIHNDFRFDNVVLDAANPLEVIGVLDWEMATIGDPLMELGSMLAYWVEADDEPAFQAMRRQPTNAPGMLTRTEVIEHYAERMDISIDCFDFYEIFGLFRLAAIAQQIYRRFADGRTTNPEFAGFGEIARYLIERSRRRIAESIL